VERARRRFGAMETIFQRGPDEFELSIVFDGQTLRGMVRDLRLFDKDLEEAV
jgi:hypothetical protein